jgi:hypothetical protein
LSTVLIIDFLKGQMENPNKNPGNPNKKLKLLFPTKPRNPN